MYPLLETICLLDGQPNNIEGHERRMKRVCRQLFVQPLAFSLADILRPSAIPKTDKRMKCRLLYNANTYTLDFSEYKLPLIHSLRCVVDNDIDYSLKYSDRSRLNELHALRAGCDEVLIIKNGYLTDTSYANIALKQDGEWFTPSEPLLQGTRRALLLASGKIQERALQHSEIQNYQAIRLFNAMIDFGEIELNINAII